MTKAGFAGGAFVAVVVLVGLAAGYRTLVRSPERQVVAPTASVETAESAEPEESLGEAAYQGFLYGRVTNVGGITYEGRLRFGGDQEAFWGDYFNGNKGETSWAALVPPEQLPKERDRVEIFGLRIVDRERDVELVRLFMTRFGDLARIEASGRDVRVTLKSGTVFDLDRLEASDFDDGVRVWDRERGAVMLDSTEIRAIELLPTAPFGDVPRRLHGTVRTAQREFTGFVQWDREECVGSDELDGESDGDELDVRFDTIRAIARRTSKSSRVTLLDGRELELSGTQDVGAGNRGVYVEDPRYGRVLIAWEAFERVDFSDWNPGGSGPAYGDFPPGRPLAGSVTTRDGRRLAGRLVYDLDESETTETLDAPAEGVNYTLAFGRIVSIVRPGREEGGAPPTRVSLEHGEELELESAGDLGEGNAGLLVFVAGGERPEYLPWADVLRIDFDRPPSTGARP